MFTCASKSLSTVARTVKALLTISTQAFTHRVHNRERKIKKLREDASQEGNKAKAS